MEVKLVLSSGYMPNHVADFEQYCALKWERDGLGKKRVHVNGGDFLAGKSIKGSYTEASALLQQVPELQITGCWNMCSEVFLDMLFTFFSEAEPGEGTRQPLGLICVGCSCGFKGVQNVCAAAGEDFAVWLASFPLWYWKYILCIITSYTTAEKELERRSC